ncbi:MAG: TRAP transporter small permease subunit [Myxococcota bacterium]
MTTILITLMNTIDAFTEKIGIAVSWLTTLLVGVVCFDVFTRYVLNSSWVAVQELEWHLFAVIFLLGASYTLKHDDHVRVDVIYSGRSRRTKAAIDLAGALLFLLPFCALVIWASITFVSSSWAVGEGSENPGGLPGRYVLKAMIPTAFVLLGLQGIALAIRSALVLAGRLPVEAQSSGDVSADAAEVP